MNFISGSAGAEQITGLSTVKTLTPPSGTLVNYGALINVVSQNVYMSTDGSTPSATNGIQLVAGQVYEFPVGTNFAALQFIEVSASATLNVSYFGG
jgi:hypothetical protein